MCEANIVQRSEWEEGGVLSTETRLKSREIAGNVCSKNDTYREKGRGTCSDCRSQSYYFQLSIEKSLW